MLLRYAATITMRDLLYRSGRPSEALAEGAAAWTMDKKPLQGRIRLRQARLPTDLATRPEPEVGERTSAIRNAILRVEKLRLANEETVRRLLEETRGEIRRSSHGRKVARGYRAQRVEEARFYDGRR